MKKEILSKLRKIQKTALSVGMKGTVVIYIASSDGTEQQFDDAIKSITEFHRFNYCFSVTPSFHVKVTFD